MEPKDDNISAMCKPAIGEAGKTGDWRDATPVIDHDEVHRLGQEPAGLLPLLALLSGRDRHRRRPGEDRS